MISHSPLIALHRHGIIGIYTIRYPGHASTKNQAQLAQANNRGYELTPVLAVKRRVRTRDEKRRECPGDEVLAVIATATAQ